jgi:Niemann-Pick C1 protein
LDRTSKAEAFTVLISYAVMFVYISIALGRIRSLKTILVSWDYKKCNLNSFIITSVKFCSVSKYLPTKSVIKLFRLAPCKKTK